MIWNNKIWTQGSGMATANDLDPRRTAALIGYHDGLAERSDSAAAADPVTGLAYQRGRALGADTRLTELMYAWLPDRQRDSAAWPGRSSP
jgi:hypothetical protein